MEPQKIESIPLENGLTLEISDFSKMVAADRWLVKLLARIEIAITDQLFNDRLPQPAPLDQIRAKLGDPVHHEYQVERNFVDSAEKDLVFKNLHAGVLTKKAYYEHPDFGPRFIIKAFADPNF